MPASIPSTWRSAAFLGLLAPVVGKQPDDLSVWILEGETRMVVREVGQLGEGGPLVSIEMAGTTFPPVTPTTKRLH